MSVRVVETGRDPTQVPDGAVLVERAVVHLGGQAAAGDVLDDHVRRPLELAEVVYVDDVGVPHLGDRLRLVAEAGDGVGVRRDRLHHLDRPNALQLGVIGAVDHPHRPLADEVLDLVRAQLRPRPDRHGP